MYRVLRGRVERFAVHYKGPKFHALLCDPPYELGFMGKDWDKSGIAFHPETWATLAEHLLPGAFGMAFASARGWHRLACAIEDAGLRIHPSIFGWNYASGFPKATRIDTQIDKKAGGERTKVGRVWSGGSRSGGIMGRNNGTQTRNITAPATDLAKTWAAHRYGLQALKPALEPIIVFQKPYKGKPVDSITETGAGALNIDGARIPNNEEMKIGAPSWGGPMKRLSGAPGQSGKLVPRTPPSNLGRWPANFYVDEEAAERLGKQSGVLKSGADCIRRKEGAFMEHGGLGAAGDRQVAYGDTGTAARFFLNVDWKLEHSDPVLYCPKANRKEREAGLEEFDEIIAKRTQDGGDDTRGRPIPRNRNPHPTVKSLKLTKWLATLLLPPEEYAPRRILVPFAGSGSEMIGAILAGWDEVIGVEMEREYCEIANARLEYWSSKQSEPELFT